jgi:hypothetical protein
MYQHPAALDYAGNYVQERALHDAEQRRMARLAGGDSRSAATKLNSHLTAAAVSLLMVLAVVALI